MLLVTEPRGKAVPREERSRARDALGLLRSPRFRALTVAAAALGLATASDGLVHLVLRDRLAFDVKWFPMLATGTAVVYMLLAAPAGLLADRVGRGRVLLGGYGLLLGVYGLLELRSPGALGLVVVLALLGAYYAATDGVLMAFGSGEAPEALRGSGLALLGTASSAARLGASLVFGALWTAFGVQTALACFAAALLVAMGLAARAVDGCTRRVAGRGPRSAGRDLHARHGRGDRGGGPARRG